VAEAEKNPDVLTENLKPIYDAAALDYDMGSFEDFTGKMRVPKNRKRFYDEFGSRLSGVKDFDEFNRSVNEVYKFNLADPKNTIADLYGRASKQYNMGELDDFRLRMATPEGRKKFHDQFAQTEKLGDFPSFESRVKDGLGYQQDIDDSLIGAAKRFGAGLVEMAANIPGGYDALNRLQNRVTKKYFDLIGAPQGGEALTREEETKKLQERATRESAKQFSEKYIGAKPGLPITFERFAQAGPIERIRLAGMLATETIPTTALLAGITAANPAAGAAILYGIESGETEAAFDELEQQGVEIDPLYRDLTVVGKGALNMALEKVGIDRILKKAPPTVRGQLFKVLAGGTAEGGTEFLQEVNAVLAETGAKLSTQEGLNLKLVFDTALVELSKNSPRLQQSFLGGVAGGTGTNLMVNGMVALDEDMRLRQNKVKLNQISIKAFGKPVEELTPEQRQQIAEAYGQAQQKTDTEKIKQAAQEAASGAPGQETPVSVRQPAEPAAAQPEPGEEAEEAPPTVDETNRAATAVARQAYGKEFEDLTPEQQDDLLDRIEKKRAKQQQSELDKAIADLFSPKKEAPSFSPKAAPPAPASGAATEKAGGAVVSSEGTEQIAESVERPARPTAKIAPAVEQKKKDADQPEPVEEPTRPIFNEGDEVEIEGRKGRFTVTQPVIDGRTQLRGQGGNTFAVATNKVKPVIKPGPPAALTGINPGDKVKLQGKEADYSFVGMTSGGQVRLRGPRGNEFVVGEGRVSKAIVSAGKEPELGVDVGGRGGEVQPEQTQVETKPETPVATPPVPPRPPAQPAVQESPAEGQPTAREFARAEEIVEKALVGQRAGAKRTGIKKGDMIRRTGRNADEKVIDVLPNGRVRLRGARGNRFTVDPDQIQTVNGKAWSPGASGAEFIRSQQAAARAALEAEGINPLIVEELTSPERTPRPREDDEILYDRNATTREGRILRAVDPPAGLKPAVERIAAATVNYRNKLAALEKAKDEIIGDIRKMGGEVVVNTQTGAFTIALRPGKPRIADADKAIIDKIKREAAEAGAYSLATVGRGFEVAAAPIRIARAASLPEGDFATRAKDFLRRNEAAKSAKETFDAAKNSARDELIDNWLAERAAGREPKAFRAAAPDGTQVEVLTRRNRSTVDPDLAVGGRDFPREVAEARAQAKERSEAEGPQGEPFLETRRTGKKKEAEAREAGTIIGERRSKYSPTPKPSEIHGALRDQDKVISDLRKEFKSDYAKRKDAGEDTERLANDAVQAISDNRRHGRILLANAISAEAREKSTVNLVGKQVKTSDDIAVLAQVYRDPRWETLRYIFVKDGKVVLVTGVSSRLPAASAAFPSDTENGIAWLKDLMFATAADGYYMLHNHPSGKVDSSFDDRKITKRLSKEVPGLKAHVIIDSNKYSVITTDREEYGYDSFRYDDGTGMYEVTIERNFGKDKLLVPSIDHPTIGRKLSSPEEIVKLGAEYKAQKGWITLISHSRNGVRGIMEVEEAVMQKPRRAQAIIRRFARQTGAPNIFLAANNEFFARNYKKLVSAVENGYLRDAVSEGGVSIQERALVSPVRIFGQEDLKAREVHETEIGYSPTRTVDSKTLPDQGKTLFQPRSAYAISYPKRAMETGPKTRDMARDALYDLGNNRRRGRVLLANAITAEAREKNVVSLVGREISTTDDVAALAQVFRDPRWETLRYILVKNGKVVSVLGVSSRLPAATAAFPVATADGYAWLRETMKNAGADSYYMVHNHPSGYVKASRKEGTDITVTRDIANNVEGFKGHVIIDSNKYTTLNVEGKGKDAKVTESQIERYFGEERLLVPSLPHPVLGAEIKNPNDVFMFGKAMETPKGWVTLIGTTGDRTRGVMAVEESEMKSPKKAAAILRKFARDTGSDSVLLNGAQSFIDQNMTKLNSAINHGFLRDAVSDRGYSVREMTEERGRLKLTGEQFGVKLVEGGRLSVQQERAARDQTKTPEFKKWFGDWENEPGKASKVVDAQGRPLVVYHGTTGDFDAFDPAKRGTATQSDDAKRGFFFTSNPEAAAAFVDQTMGDELQFGANIIPAFVNIKNPAIWEWGGGQSSADQINKAISDAKTNGHDGLILVNIRDRGFNPGGRGILSTHVIVFKPIQIKSAIGNVGAFDPFNPSIIAQPESTYGRAGLTREELLDIGRTVNELVSNKALVNKLAKGEKKYVANLIDTLNRFEEVSKKANLTAVEQAMVRRARKLVDAKETTRVLEKVRQMLEDNKQVEITWLDKVVEFSAAMKLFRLSSIGTSLTSNLASNLIRYPTMRLSAWFNEGIARRNGAERTRFDEEAMLDFKATWMNGELRNSLGEAMKIFREEETAIAESTLLKREHAQKRAIGGTAGKVIRASFNAQAAIDVLFRNPKKAGARSALAWRWLMRNTNDKGEALERMDEMVRMVDRTAEISEQQKRDATVQMPEELEPFVDIVKAAEIEAEKTTFQEKLEGLMGKIGELRQSPGVGGKLVRMIVPFYNTSMNVLKQAFQHTPLGLMTPRVAGMMERYVKKTISADEAGELSDRVAQAVVGSASATLFIAGLMTLSDDDDEIITGDYDQKTIKEKPLGWQPNSVKVGGTYVSMNGIQPLGKVLTIFANMREGKEDKGWEGAVAGLTKTLVSNPLTDQMHTISEVDKGNVVNFLADMTAGAVIPGIVQDVARIADPVIREKEGVVERFQSRLPFVSRDLPAKIDIFGQELEPQTSGEKALKAVTGVGISALKEDAARQEVRRLKMSQSAKTRKHEGVELTASEVLRLNIQVGKAFHNEVRKVIELNPTYRSFSDDDKNKYLNAVRRTVFDYYLKAIERHPSFRQRKRAVEREEKFEKRGRLSERDRERIRREVRRAESVE